MNPNPNINNSTNAIDMMQKANPLFNNPPTSPTQNTGI